MKYAIALSLLLLLGCEGGSDEPGGRIPVRFDGVMFLDHTGLDAFGEPGSGAYLEEGYAAWWIHHPLSDTGEPEPAHLEIAFDMGWSFGYDREIQWGKLETFRVRIRQAATTPLGTRTLFTDDIGSVTLRFEQASLELDADGESYTVPGRRFEGQAELEVFAADLDMRAVWGRFVGELWPLDGADGPYPVRAEFAAAAGFKGCSWEMPPWPNGAYRTVSTPPPDRLDECAGPWAAIQAAPAHPDGPPLPPFAEFFNSQFPPDRWPGLDRDL